MLDPEHKDVSIDLDTYHAVMREWIDDCRNNGYWITNMTFTLTVLILMYRTFYLAMMVTSEGSAVHAKTFLYGERKENLSVISQ